MKRPKDKKKVFPVSLKKAKPRGGQPTKMGRSKKMRGMSDIMRM